MKTKIDPIFVLCPAFVKSKNDGQQHFINEEQLLQLYGVPPWLCVLIESREHLHLTEEGRHVLYHLRPRYNGDYSLPEYIKAGMRAALLTSKE